MSRLARVCQLLVILLVVSGLIFPPSTSATARANNRPFSLPFNTPPGPATWLLGQQYGNTTGAFNLGAYWYGSGQGLHFGLDFNAPCQTDVVAIADGVVQYVDNFVFGLQPHNLVITHPDLGYASLYGHLYARPTVQKGQQIKRGQVIAQTGDPDLTCVSRPHLHLEIRDIGTLYTAYDPAALIDADWPMLSTVGSYGNAGFVKDLYHPRRWQTLDDQPLVHFQGPTLNRYLASYPPRQRVQAPAQTLSAFSAPPIPQGTMASIRQLTTAGCCSLAWWAPDGKSVRFHDGPDGQLAKIMGVSVDGEDSTPSVVDPVPLKMWSPDGQYEVRWEDGIVTVTRLADKTSWRVPTSGVWPRFSPESKQLLWQTAPADNVPGTNPPQTKIWISAPDGKDAAVVATHPGGSVYWLDEDRLLITERLTGTLSTTLSVYTISTKKTEPLGKFTNIRNLSIAPGGKALMFYVIFQPDPSTSAAYLLETTPGAVPQKLPFFGGWRWRDSNSVIYIPFTPGQPAVFTLYDITSGRSQQLTDPAKQTTSIANDDWSVSPNGQYIVYWDAQDLALRLVTLPQ